MEYTTFVHVVDTQEELVGVDADEVLVEVGLAVFDGLVEVLVEKVENERGTTGWFIADNDVIVVIIINVVVIIDVVIVIDVVVIVIVIIIIKIYRI